MKKSIVVLMTILALLFVGDKGGAAEVEKCTMPAGAHFVIYHMIMGPVPVVSPKDQTVTILEVLKGKDPKTGGVIPVVRFSLVYDDIAVACNIHGEDPYDTYKQNLRSEDGLVRKDFLKCDEELTSLGPKTHAHPYHPSPATATPVECIYDTCPYQPYYHEHEGYPEHRHEYKGEYQGGIGKGFDF